MSTNIEELTKAAASLRTATELLKKASTLEPDNFELHKALRDAGIQRFEFCIELAWKTSIKLLGLETKAPYPAIRDMAQNKLIDDTQIWFEFLIARNKTSHTYTEEIAKSVYVEVERLLPELDKLLFNLKKLK